ncbi:MAG: hypothetical protein UV32_C0012G0040 [Candidatus Collierbacteria bacterium GW2011_GWF2_42_51]|nr:MAG: hypothetical protein UV32_C0012G0040 [Candidatus Collierbacteria bacterium GW2011_GWF2_42_51]
MLSPLLKVPPFTNGGQVAQTRVSNVLMLGKKSPFMASKAIGGPSPILHVGNYGAKPQHEGKTYNQLVVPPPAEFLK